MPPVLGSRGFRAVKSSQSQYNCCLAQFEYSTQVARYRSVSATPNRQRSVLVKLETFIPVESLFGYISSVSDPKSRIAAVANKQQLGVGNQQACSLYQIYDCHQLPTIHASSMAAWLYCILIKYPMSIGNIIALPKIW